MIVSTHMHDGVDAVTTPDVETLSLDAMNSTRMFDHSNRVTFACEHDKAPLEAFNFMFRDSVRHSKCDNDNVRKII